MPIEDFIIQTYCFVEDFLQNLYPEKPLRQRGPLPHLSDSEVITMEIVGEYLGFGYDKDIWHYFKEHWLAWFPKLPCRTSFARQSANLLFVKTQIQKTLSHNLGADQDLFLFDGFPIPICHIKRYKRSTSSLRSEGRVGYCAAKDEKYFGFKGHLLITQQGVAQELEIAPANVDERDILPELTHSVTGTIIADKGLIRPQLKAELTFKGVNLQTPLRANMKDNRPKSFVSALMNIRRKIETVIGQLVERFHIQSIRAKDLWHLQVKISRKILAHTVCFMINQTINPENPLALENILS